jgi:hypothetical protein
MSPSSLLREGEKSWEGVDQKNRRPGISTAQQGFLPKVMGRRTAIVGVTSIPEVNREEPTCTSF